MATRDSTTAAPNGRVEDTEEGGTAERLQQAAREAFADLGWRRTRVQDVVDRAGVSHGTFYTYFANRAAALDALIDEVEEGFLELGRRPWGGEDVCGALEAVIGGFLRHYQAHAPVIQTWIDAGLDRPEFAVRYQRARELLIERVAEQLAATAAASGRTRQRPSPSAVAATLVSMVEHVAWSWMTVGEPDDDREVLESLVLVWGAALNELAGFRIVEFDGPR